MRSVSYYSRRGSSKLSRQGLSAVASGFTIVETMIVLAIAGLILLLILEVIPSFDRSARNNERKQDVSTILNAVSQYELRESDNFPLPCGGSAPYACNYPSGSSSNNYFLRYAYGHLTIYRHPGDVVLYSQCLNSATSCVVAPQVQPETNTQQVEVYNYEECNAPPYSQSNPAGGANSTGADYSSVVALYALESGTNSYSSQCQHI